MQGHWGGGVAQDHRVPPGFPSLHRTVPPRVTQTYGSALGFPSSSDDGQQGPSHRGLLPSHCGARTLSYSPAGCAPHHAWALSSTFHSSSKSPPCSNCPSSSCIPGQISHLIFTKLSYETEREAPPRAWPIIRKFFLKMYF